jgi:hypothetical protein
METMTYNGWTNWETWNVELWIDNEEGIYREKQRFLRRNSEEDEIDADKVEKFCRDIFPDGTPDMKDDPRGDMNRVNWEELAESWSEEAKEYR